MSPWTNSTSLVTSSIRRSDHVEARLSTTTTRCPCVTSARTRFEPMKPAPPVTTTRIQPPRNLIVDPKSFPMLCGPPHSRLPPLMAIATLIRMPSVVGRYALTLNRTPPLSVAYLAGSLTAAGRDVQVIDAVGEDIGAMHLGYRDDIVING